MDPVQVAVISTGDGGLKHDTVAHTPPGQPNVLFNVVSPAVALAVRFANQFVTTFVGLIPVAVGAAQADLFHANVAGMAITAFSVASVDFLKNLVTIFKQLEQRYPLLTGSV